MSFAGSVLSGNKTAVDCSHTSTTVLRHELDLSKSERLRQVT